VAILRAGQLVATEAIQVLRQRAVRRVEIRFGVPVPAAAFQRLPGVRAVAVDDQVLRCVVEGTADALVKAAAQFPVLSLLSHEPDLEEVFLAYYTEGSEPRAASRVRQDPARPAPVAWVVVAGPSGGDRRLRAALPPIPGLGGLREIGRASGGE